MDSLFRIELLGQLRVRCGERSITRFRTQKTGALLAYLAFYPHTPHPRERLIDLFWPDSSPADARQSLSQCLSWLRREFRTLGIPPTGLLQAERFTVGLRPGAFTTDVAEFEFTLDRAHKSESIDERIALWLHAAKLHTGELLPGYYEDWSLREQQQLADRYFGAIHDLATALQESGKHDQALEVVRRAVRLDPLREEARIDLLKLLLTGGQSAAALREYREMERLFLEQLGETPGEAVQALIRPIQRPSAVSSGIPAMNGSASLLSPPPLPLTRFFGRERELEQLERLLLAEAPRLVTLTGLGGSGKTRLAVEAAHRLFDSFEGALWLVPLADLPQPGLIPERVAEAMGLQRSPDGNALEEVIEALSARPGLLIFDNFEHLLDGGEAVSSLLQRIPTLRCLVTSRQALGLSGETELVVAPLSLPQPDADLEQITGNESVQLFLDRAQAVRTDFHLSNENAATVAEVCARLEGLPLAIELAAARSKVIAPLQMLGQLEHRFDFLVSRKRDLPERHRSLRATIDWTYRLLSPRLQLFFRGLSVFRGGWTAESAASVCGASLPKDGEDRPANLLNDLEQLEECSLILTEERSGAVRFRMLETLRDFAREQLLEAEEAAVQHRHFFYFLSLAEQAETALEGGAQAAWLDRLDAEHDNLRAALHHCVQRRPEAGLQLAGALCPFWLLRGALAEGREWLRMLFALAPEGGDASLQAKALNGAGLLAIWQGDYTEAHRLLEQSMAITQRTADRPNHANALMHLGLIAHNQSRYPLSRRYYEEGLAIYREMGDRQGIGFSLARLGTLLCSQSDHPASERFCREALALYRELGNRSGEAGVLNTLGNVACRTQEYEAAKVAYEQALALRRDLRDQLGISIVLQNLGIVTHRQGENERARALFEESLSLRRDLGDKGGIVNVLVELGAVMRDLGDFPAAREHYREALLLQRTLGHQGGLEGFAGLLALQGESERAVRLFAAEEAQRDSIHAPLPVDEQPVHDAFLARLKDALGEAVFQTEWERGRALPWDAAVADALEESKTSGEW